MTHTKDTPCQGGCGKVRSILYSDSPSDWLCNECSTRKISEDADSTLPKVPEEAKHIADAWTLLKSIHSDVETVKHAMAYLDKRMNEVLPPIRGTYAYCYVHDTTHFCEYAQGAGRI